jgi:hypothetical protein
VRHQLQQSSLPTVEDKQNEHTSQENPDD